MSEDSGFELVMPFVTVKSQGGDHDDASYVCGYECGYVDTKLQFESPRYIERYVHGENIEQLDLIAMARGYTLECADSYHEWVRVKLTKVAE